MTQTSQAEDQFKRYLQQLRQAKLLTGESRPNTINMIRFNRRVNLIKSRPQINTHTEEPTGKQAKLIDTPMTKVTVTTAIRPKKIRKVESNQSTPQNYQKTIKKREEPATEKKNHS